jgi:hypothetical protein
MRRWEAKKKRHDLLIILSFSYLPSFPTSKLPKQPVSHEKREDGKMRSWEAKNSLAWHFFS